jgi:flagellar protein FlgJ
MTKQDFANKFYPLAKIAGDRFGLNPIVILAQAAHESGWGDSYAVRNRKNFFGIIAAGSPNEFWDGAKSQSSASGLWFRVYKTEQDSFSDFARLISSKYKDAAALSFDAPAYAHAIAYSPYISEANGDNRPAYETAVKNNADFFSKFLAPQILRDKQEAEKKK